MSRRAGFVLAIGLVLAAGLQTVTSEPTLYDGLPLPEAPYNYCSPPANLKSSNKPPDGGQAAFPVQNGKVLGGGVQTGDAQVVVFIGVGALQASPAAASVLVSVDPVCQTPPAGPKEAQILGNVYRISAVEQPSLQPVTVGAAYRVTMRYPTGGVRDIELYDGASWHPTPTTLAPGGNPYAGAIVPQLGEVAIVGHASQPESTLTVIARFLEGFGILALVILFGIIALIQEIRRRRRRA